MPKPKLGEVPGGAPCRWASISPTAEEARGCTGVSQCVPKGSCWFLAQGQPFTASAPTNPCFLSSARVHVPSPGLSLGVCGANPGSRPQEWGGCPEQRLRASGLGHAAPLCSPCSWLAALLNVQRTCRHDSLTAMWHYNRICSVSINCYPKYHPKSFDAQ